MGACMSSGNASNTSSNNESKKKKRSSSMQYLWKDKWDDVIEDRDSQRMKSESETTQCTRSSAECNCVQRAIFVMNIYKFWNDRKHIELDIDHIVEVITTELDHYSSGQMILDFKHCKSAHDINDLHGLFQTKCKNCGGDDCPVMIRQRVDSDGDTDLEQNNTQRASTFAQIKPDSLRLMKILDHYHCYFLHKVESADVE
mmetsp:Transcript_38660/g.61713  ORF Transcript_38660/g.61713 Transcript_38660/m.61713 type:complete len:200 (+) Transcript_38660:32-631(+)